MIQKLIQLLYFIRIKKKIYKKINFIKKIYDKFFSEFMKKKERSTVGSFQNHLGKGEYF